MTKVQIEHVRKRVNAAANFWADTKGVDYLEGLLWEEIKAYDKENFESYFLFKKELGACGYY